VESLWKRSLCGEGITSIRSARVGMWDLCSLDPGSRSRVEKARSGKIDNLVACPGRELQAKLGRGRVP
jgi:hypothetical protein